jgi:ribA/ribD-fused uncharacterized protein
MDPLPPYTVYRRDECAVFHRNSDRFAPLGNMVQWPLIVGGMRFRSSEALYQACRFPHRPDIQELIIAARGALVAKKIAREHESDSRSDWMDVRVPIMRWCVGVKLAQYYQKMGALLRDTGDRPIVELSWKDDFWGAVPDAADSNALKGRNVLGLMLVELRAKLDECAEDRMRIVQPPALGDLILLGREALVS